MFLGFSNEGDATYNQLLYLIDKPNPNKVYIAQFFFQILSEILKLKCHGRTSLFLQFLINFQRAVT